MRNIFLFLMLILFFSGCKNEIIPPSSTDQDGQIILKIDRLNAPQNITTVTAYLTRPNFTNITGSLNLLTDSTADLSLTDIAAGPWHLKVDAADSTGAVKYSGQTNVEIIENQTIQVTLTLIPVLGGVGNIYLYVSWGVPSGWFDFPGNPIMTGINAYEPYGVYQGKVIFDENKYKMWFTGVSGGGMCVIEYAESVDGKLWTRPVSNPVLFPGPAGWDDESISLPVVIKENNQYKMYYHGRSSLYGHWNIGLATSSDGINWIKNPEPVLYGTSGWEYQVAPCDIIKKDNVYYLYYNGIIYTNSQTEHRIGLATSSDGINFTRYQNNPILVATQPWEGTYIMSPSVIYEDDSFKMVYASASGYGLGEATSSDGVNWIKSPNNPFFTPQNTHNHWADRILYPDFRKYVDGYRIYYGTHTPSFYCKMGLLTKMF